MFVKDVPVLPSATPEPAGFDKIGTELLNGLLLQQYRDSVNLNKYLLAFIEELDLLFHQMYKVTRGRFIENAEGAQLDIIGAIVGQTRRVVTTAPYFGFQGAVGALGMADASSPTQGGVFRDANEPTGGITPLNDVVFRRIVMTVAYLNNVEDRSQYTVYSAIESLLGRSPKTLELRVIAPRNIQLYLGIGEVTDEEVELIRSLQYIILGMGTIFEIILV